MQCASWSSGRVMLSEPRNDFASGVRELATTTASLMVFLSVLIWRDSHRGRRRTQRELRTSLCSAAPSVAIHMKNAVNHYLVTNRLRLFNRSTIASGAFSGEPASKGGCGSYSTLN